MKSNQVTVRQRVEEVLNLRLLGAEFLDIRHHSAAQEWNVSDRQLWRYVAAGDKILAETLEKDREKLVNRHIAMRRALYARTMAVSDYGTALRVLDSDAKMLGLADAELSRLVDQLQKEIEEIKRHAHGNPAKATGNDASGSDDASATGTADPSASAV